METYCKCDKSRKMKRKKNGVYGEVLWMIDLHPLIPSGIISDTVLNLDQT